MTTDEAIKVLKKYNKWRIGDAEDIPMLDPKIVTEAINVAIKDMENTQKSMLKTK